MIAALLGLPSLLIRNKGAAGADSGAAGTAPACYPQPPAEPPTAFSVTAASVGEFTISVAISPAVSIATITTAQLAASTQLVVQGSVPGCTFAITGSPVVSGIQISGTPSTKGDYRVILTCVKSDTCETLGSMVYEVSILDPAVTLVVTSQANFTGRAGQPVDTLLCNLSLGYDWDATAHPNDQIDGCELVFAWIRSGTSTGSLRLVGTPTYTDGLARVVTVTYRHGSRVLGTSVHTITIGAAWVAAPPPPAPAPPPPAPSPTPAPTPAPAPVPGPLAAADERYADVLALYNFEDVAEVPANQQEVGGGGGGFQLYTPPRGDPLTPPEGSVLSFLGGAAIELRGGAGWPTTASWASANMQALTVECMVQFSDMGLWGRNAGTFVPCVSLAAEDGSLLWALGLLRVDVIEETSIGPARAAVLPAFIQGASGGFDGPLVALGAEVSPTTTAGKHLAGSWSISGSTVSQACWWDGVKGTTETETKQRDGAAGDAFRMGGDCPQPGYSASLTLPLNATLPMTGILDEVRVTGGATPRYSLASDIAPINRVVPWPTY